MAKQMELDLDVKETKYDGPVTCLGMEFSNDEARYVHYIEFLRKKLKDPEFRKIEGFPIGEDEDILALSDPPYYTACPNPWIGEFINQWETDKPEKPEGYHYHREPFAADVSEGKNDPIYNAHSYHTKVPHKAIMRYILHYTEPGDIVFDGFCGTGMTGVAAQMCGDQATVESLGYQVKKDGTILQQAVNEFGKTVWQPFSRLGARKIILNDLSPAATSIAYNYNTPVDVQAFEREVKRILAEVEKECGWMYETIHTDGKTKGKINYTVWSDVFICPECAEEVVFWEAAADKEIGKIRQIFSCPHCKAELTKRKMERAWTTKFDNAITKPIKQAKQIPVFINYSVGKKRMEKMPSNFDLQIIEQIENLDIPYWFPSNRMIDGKESRRNDPVGLTHSHQFYTKRNLIALTALKERIAFSQQKGPLTFVFTSAMQYLNRLCRLHIGNHFHRKGGTVDKPLEGTLYFPSVALEVNVLTKYQLRARIGKSLVSKQKESVICCASANELSNIDDNSIDYIFIDPPFGANLNYSELNSLWEAWLKLKTDINPEAIENKAHNKNTDDYRRLMFVCFQEAYRILKPGRWMTVEFSNTKSLIWNSIQSALLKAGFITANVSSLDKKKGSFKAVTTPTAVKQDLVLSVYKPNGGFRERFESEATSEEGVWDFVRTHLKYLPVIKETGAYYNMKKAAVSEEAVADMKPKLQAVPERDPRILYDQVVSYYVRNNIDVPLSSPEFQQGLETHFIQRDGMFFLPEQASAYDTIVPIIRWI